ncbi:glycosyltransferase family 4 protein [bacterium]|nr:glycosyltransferase family 4 protein [bacterium]
MRIAVIGIRGIPANYGGFEVTAQNVVSRLAEKGHEITVYCRGWRKGKPKTFDGINLKYLPSLELPHLSTPSHTAISAVDAIFRKYDVIFAFNIGNAIDVLLLKIFGKRSVMFVDGLDWKREKYGVFGRWFLRKSEALAAKVAAHIVVDAIPAQRHYLETYGKNVEYIPSGSEIVESVERTGILEKLGLQPKRYVATIGRLTPEKRQDLIAKVFKQVKTDMKLVIVGGNRYLPDFVERVKQAAQGDDRIIVPGPIYGAEADELYFNAAVFVNASTIEGTSLSILQAMGNGCALLVSDISENVSAVYDAALVFQTNSFDDFLQKFQKIVDDEDLRNVLSQKAKEVIRKYYSWDIAAEKFEKLLLDAAKKN